MDAYIFQAALLCTDCAHKVRRVTNASLESDDYPQGPYSDGGGEFDCPQHCDHCGVFLENPLTIDGYGYVRTSARNDEWVNFYELDSED